MIVENNIVPSSSAELLGDAHPLLEQLGTAESVSVNGALTQALELRSVTDLPSLRSFLDAYRKEILLPVEFPAIVHAHQHASRGEANELIALDTQLASEAAIRPFAIASCRVGQRQLSKLRPMRDQRLVQRYLAAIEDGRARGWHTLVYGVSLAMFSLPLRQGLQNYAEQTVRGFVESASRSLRLREADCESLLAVQAAEVPVAIAAMLEASKQLRIS